MVCAKCQKLAKPTALATPGIKKKSELYYGSPAGSKTTASKTSATIGNTGIGKVRLFSIFSTLVHTNGLQSKLLSAGAKNPYAAYSMTCTGKECAVKIESGRKYCNKCAYKANGECLLACMIAYPS